MISYLLVGVLVVVVWGLLFGALFLVQRSRENGEYMDRVQQRMDQIADTT